MCVGSGGGASFRVGEPFDECVRPISALLNRIQYFIRTHTHTHDVGDRAASRRHRRSVAHIHTYTPLAPHRIGQQRCVVCVCVFGTDVHLDSFVAIRFTGSFVRIVRGLFVRTLSSFGASPVALSRRRVCCCMCVCVYHAYKETSWCRTPSVLLYVCVCVSRLQGDVLVPDAECVAVCVCVCITPTRRRPGAGRRVCCCMCVCVYHAYKETSWCRTPSVLLYVCVCITPTRRRPGAGRRVCCCMCVCVYHAYKETSWCRTDGDPIKEGCTMRIIRGGGHGPTQQSHAGWLASAITLIPNTSNTSDYTQFRGITLLSAGLKVLTYIIAERHQAIPLHRAQHGFRHNRSTHCTPSSL